MNEKALRLLYNDIGNSYDVGTFEEFKLYLSDSSKRQMFFNEVIQPEYDVESITDFESTYGLNTEVDSLKKKEDFISPTQENNSVLDSELDPTITDSLGTSPTNLTPEVTENFSIEGKTVTKEEFDAHNPDPYAETLLADDYGSDEFEQSLKSSVNAEMIEKEEEFVVPEMQYKFGRYGFIFEKEDWMGDEMRVTADNGKELQVELDRLWSKESTAKELEQFLRDNKVEADVIAAKSTAIIKNEKIIQDENQVLETVKVFNKETENFESQVKEYATFKEAVNNSYNENFSNVTKEQLEKDPVLAENYKAWENAKAEEIRLHSELKTKQSEFSSRGRELDVMAAKYVEMQSKQGGYFAGTINGFLDGAARFATTAMDTFIDAGTYAFTPEVMEDDWYKSELIRVAREQGNVPIEYQEKGESDEPELDAEGMPIGKSEGLRLEDLSTEELTKVLGGDSNDFKWIANTMGKIGMAKTIGMSAFSLPGPFYKETAYDNAHSKVMDNLRKAYKYEEGTLGNAYAQVVKGRYRNPFSSTAFKTDTSLGALDATRKGLRSQLGDDSATEAWTKAEKEGFWGGAYLGLVESLPAMIGSSTPVGWAQRTAQMYSQVSDHVMEEMEEDDSFDNISENEKAMVKMPIGIAVGTLEAIGFRNVLNQKGFLNKVVGRALGKYANKSTELVGSRNFAEFIRQDVETMMARGVLTLAASGMAEFETGFAQEIAEIGIKDIYNSVKESEMFTTPDTWGDYAAQVIRAGAQEAVGGFIMGSPSAVANSLSGMDMKSLDNTVFEVFEKITQDPALKTMYVTKLKQRIADPQSDTDAKSAQKELDIVNQLEGLIPQIPVDYTTEQKKEALQLLFQKNALENEIKTEDKVLSKRKQELLDKVNNRLAKITNQTINEQEGETTSTTKVQDFADGEVETETTQDDDVTTEEQTDIETFFNPDGKVTEDSETKGPNLSINRNKAPKLNSQQNKIKNRLVKVAEMGAKAISKILPDVRMVLHENNEEYLRFAKRGKGRAEYNPENKIIHINLSEATTSTVPHEIFHAVLIEKIKGDPAIAKAAETMMLSVRKSLANDSELAQKIDKFAAAYTGTQEQFQNEERLAELIGILSSAEVFKGLSKPTKNIIIQWLKDFAKKYGIKIGSDFGKNDSDVIDLLNTIARKTRTGEEIEESDISLLESEPYSGGMKVESTENNISEPRQEKIIYKDLDFVEEIEVTTMQEFVERVKGKLFTITSDATKVGFDKQGNRVDGGFGYTALTENVEGDVGFASLDMSVAAITIAKIAKQFKAGETVGVLIMVQNPSATIGNIYGGKYLGRGLATIQKANPELYNKVYESIVKFAKTNVAVVKHLAESKSEAQLLELLKNPQAYTEQEFADEWIKDTSFNARREMLKSMIINSSTTRTDKGTPDYKIALKEAGFTMQDFLMEYGDVELLGENNLKEDNGGFLVGGFEMIVPKNIEQAVADVENKGFTHPQFNGKLPSTGKHVMFDGLYPIQENLVEFAKEETQLKKITRGKADASVRELSNKVDIYHKKFTDPKSDKFVKAEDRGYTQMTTASKIIFKKNNPNFVEPKVPNLKASTARGMPTRLDKDIPKGTEFKSEPRQQKNIEEIAKYYNMNTQGFFPNNAEVFRFRKSVEELGYKLKQSKTDQYGRGGSYYLVNSRGKKVNPLSSRARQQKSITELVNESRENNFREPVIRDFLVRVKKFSAKEVDKLMEISIDLLQSMPKSFGAIEGGAQEGIKLFKKVEAFRIRLTKKNNKIKLDDQISEQEIIDKTIEFLEAQPQYINESDTYTKGNLKKGTQVTINKKELSTQQAAMVIDLQSSIGIRPTENMASKLRRARVMLKQRTKGGRDLNKIKTEIRNFIRKSLPKSIYTKPRVIKLINTIAIANEENIENILDEVAQFVIEENVKNLQTKLEKILSGKFQKDQSGRRAANRVDNETRKRIEKIKKAILNKKSTDQEVDDANAALMKEFNELSKETEQSNESRQRMVDLQMIMEYNNSIKMLDNNSNKVTQLDSLVSTLEEIIKYGRSILKQELLDSHLKYQKTFELGYEAITGNKIDMSNEEKAKKELANQQYERDNDANRKKVRGKIVNGIQKIYSGVVDGVFGTAEALYGLMDKIDVLPGEMFGGILQEMFTEEIDEASRIFKGRRMMVEAVIQNKLLELYGKKWRKQSRKNRVDFETFIYINEEMRLKNKGEILSQNKMAYLYNMYKDPANEKSFEKKYGPEYKRVMEEIEFALDPKVKELADWQVDEFYPSLYDHYNQAYKEIYRTDMPWNQFYSGMIYREGIESEPLDMLANDNMHNTNVGTASTKSRIHSSLAIKSMDMVDVMATYVNEMEYVAAYAVPMRNMNKFFTNKNISSAITAIHGKLTNQLITNMIQKIASKGIDQGLGNNFVNNMNSVFIMSRLAISPVVMIKQLTSFLTYASDIGFINYVKYAAKNKTQQIEIWKEVRDNSVYMQDRGNNSILRAIETYSEESMKEFVPRPAKDWIVNFMMWTTKFGDKTAIMVGGLPNYSYYKATFKKKNPNATEQESIDYAIRKFEQDTKRTQQSGDLQDKDLLQTANPITRALNMFLTTPKQYLRKEIVASRGLYRKVKAWDKNAGKGTIWENVRTLMMYHFVMPLFFQYVAMGLPGILRGFRDDDDEDLIRAAVIGNFNALFILGELVAGAGDLLTGKPWAGNSAKTVGILQIGNALIRKAKKIDTVKDPVKKAKAMKDFWLEFMTLTGIPALTIDKFIENYGEIGTDGDMGRDILRLLNYSKYQQVGPKSSKKTSKIKTVAEMNEEYAKSQRKKEKEKKKAQGNFLGGGYSNGGYSGGGFDGGGFDGGGY